MKVDEYIAKLRIRLDDPIRTIPADQLWKTDELLDYSNDSLNEFARSVEYWTDSTTPDICSVPVVTGQRWVTIDDRIIRIRRAKLGLDMTPLVIRDSRIEDIEFTNWGSDNNTGSPRILMLGEEEGKGLFDTLPIVDDIMSLGVVRYPLCGLKLGMDMPIPDRYCLKLFAGARSLAYKKQDADTFDVNRSLNLGAEFESELLKIKHELKKKRHHPRSTIYRDVG